MLSASQQSMLYETARTQALHINRSAAQEISLTDRQLEASLWVAQGKTDNEIGIIIDCTGRTAKHHVLNAMARTNTHTRAQLIAQLFLQGIFEARTVATALTLCIMFTLAGGYNSSNTTYDDTLARRIRGRRARDLTALEEADDLPSFLHNDWQQLASHAPIKPSATKATV
ncbi:helix-turn-helix domain-containing protein [Aliamphritea ceti]|uniref:helix-turn-helix domain-containing protein n=1 Tax=Aliamphritea ceti TaxID=1524258 RepID=UPI0021C36BD9|nr:helix-turn-helix transcriptional regulator [Aliamphritea ceti]